MTPTPTTIADSCIDHERDVWAWLAAHGLPADRLVDPAHLTPAHVRDGDLDALRLVTWDSGPTEHPVDIEDLVDAPYSGAAAGIQYGRLDAVQPVGMESALNTDREGVTVFAFDKRRYPELDAADVVAALDRIDYRTPLRMPTVDAWADALGVDHNIEYWEADAHGKWVRADEIPRRFVLEVDGLEARSPDDDITGHKKRARQRFYRNRDRLQEAGEVADV